MKKFGFAAIATSGLAAAMLGLAGPDTSAAVVPDDARLDPVRARLTEQVEKASAAGLPVEVIVGKIREGLAKGVDGDRIAAATARST